jgi:hypothetical protein
MLASAACFVACAVCFLCAISTKPRTLPWYTWNLWFRLPSEGIKLRNIGVAFWLGAVVLCGVGWLLLSV